MINNDDSKLKHEVAELLYELNNSTSQKVVKDLTGVRPKDMKAINEAYGKRRGKQEEHKAFIKTDDLEVLDKYNLEKIYDNIPDDYKARYNIKHRY